MPMNPMFRVAILASVLALASTATTSRAQPGPPPAPSHVGIVKFRLVYENMKQTLDSDLMQQGMLNRLNGMAQDHQKQLDALQKQIADAVKNHTDRSALVDLLDDKLFQFQLEEATIKIGAQRARNRHFKQAFDQIKAATADIAAKRGFDTVLVDNSAPIPPDAGELRNLDTLGGLLFNRDVLYMADTQDLSVDVITQLNSNFTPTTRPAPVADLPTTRMQVGSKTFNLEIAGDEASQHLGMMERDSIAIDHGMIFVFPVAGEQSFWGRHTRFPLDVLFIDGKGTVVSIKRIKPYDESSVPSDGISKYAIEIPGGQAAASGVKIGDQLKIPPVVDASLKVEAPKDAPGKK